MRSGRSEGRDNENTEEEDGIDLKGEGHIYGIKLAKVQHFNSTVLYFC